MMCGFLSNHAEAEETRACGVFLSSFGRLELFSMVAVMTLSDTWKDELCGWTLWLIMSIILNLIG